VSTYLHQPGQRKVLAGYVVSGFKALAKMSHFQSDSYPTLKILVDNLETHIRDKGLQLTQKDGFTTLTVKELVDGYLQSPEF
jgi:hypothetical protein